MGPGMSLLLPVVVFHSHPSQNHNVHHRKWIKPFIIVNLLIAMQSSPTIQPSTSFLTFLVISSHISPQRPRHSTSPLLRNYPSLPRVPLVFLLQTRHEVRPLREGIPLNATQTLLHRHGIRPFQSLRQRLRLPLPKSIRHQTCSRR